MTVVGKANLAGAVTAVAFLLSAALVFVFRLMGSPGVGYWLGIAEFCMAVPAIYLLAIAPKLKRPALYYVQLCLLLAWLVAELMLDYVFAATFRQNVGMLIGYVVLFFAGSGGMIGIASLAGKGWSITAVLLFLAMTALAFVQRFGTGEAGF